MEDKKIRNKVKDKDLDKVPFRPGLNKHIFESLKKTFKPYFNQENVCILSFDEMDIKNPDQLEGLQDNGDQNKVHKAVIFMLSGLTKNWKQPIAFYLLDTFDADTITVIVKEVLKECFKADMPVVATICDTSSIHMNVLKHLGATNTNPCFTLEGKEVVSILDPPYLLKSTRNLFMEHDIEFFTEISLDGKPVNGPAKWSHLELFQKVDEGGFIEFAPGLTENHFHPNEKDKKRTDMAAQIFSHRVTSGFLGKMAFKELPSEAVATATLLNKFDQLLDALNSNTPKLRKGKPYSNNMTKKTQHIEFLNEMRKFISSMKFIGSKNSDVQEGWIHTLNGVEKLWENIQVLKIKSLSTRRLNQDALNNFIGCINHYCECNDCPTKVQFVAAFKTAILNKIPYCRHECFCQDDEGVLVDSLKRFL